MPGTKYGLSKCELLLFLSFASTFPLSPVPCHSTLLQSRWIRWYLLIGPILFRVLCLCCFYTKNVFVSSSLLLDILSGYLPLSRSFSNPTFFTKLPLGPLKWKWSLFEESIISCWHLSGYGIHHLCPGRESHMYVAYHPVLKTHTSD